MNRRNIRPVVYMVTALLSLAGPVRAGDLPTVDAILDRYVQALGGRETIEKLDTRTLSGVQIDDRPYQGPPGCLEIPFDQGVCGAAAAQQTTQVVEDVHAFPGHIACDAASRIEELPKRDPNEEPITVGEEALEVPPGDAILFRRFDERTGRHSPE